MAPPTATMTLLEANAELRDRRGMKASPILSKNPDLLQDGKVKVEMLKPRDELNDMEEMTTRGEIDDGNVKKPFYVNRIKKEYEVWMRDNYLLEPVNFVIDNLLVGLIVTNIIYLLTQCNVADLYPGAESWTPIFLSRLIGCIFVEPFAFTSVHLYLHFGMLQGYQFNRKVCLPMAFYHHYTDSRVYGLVPHTYRVVTTVQQCVMYSIISLIIGGDPVLSLTSMIVLYIDVMVHEWYHTHPSKYVSMNPLSAKFVGVNYFMLFLGKLGMVDREEHKMEHHDKRADEMHDTHQWVDMRVQGSTQLAEFYGESAWELIKAGLRYTRGTSDAVPVANERQFKIGLVFLYSYVLLNAFVFYAVCFPGALWCVEQLTSGMLGLGMSGLTYLEMGESPLMGKLSGFSEYYSMHSGLGTANISSLLDVRYWMALHLVLTCVVKAFASFRLGNGATWTWLKQGKPWSGQL